MKAPFQEVPDTVDRGCDLVQSACKLPPQAFVEKGLIAEKPAKEAGPERKNPAAAIHYKTYVADPQTD